MGLQGYLAHKKQRLPLGPPYDPRHSPTAGSQGGVVSYERDTPVWDVRVWGHNLHPSPPDAAGFQHRSPPARTVCFA